jgi:hypothetical protein
MTRAKRNLVLGVQKKKSRKATFQFSALMARKKITVHRRVG